MPAATLQQILDTSGNVVDLLRNSVVARTEYASGWRAAQSSD
jgi:hypothetical protein